MTQYAEVRFLNGTQIEKETRFDAVSGAKLYDILYFYDVRGAISSMTIYTHVGSNTTVESYFYQTNIQGDVLGIFDENGTLVAKYTYNAWGEHTVTSYNGSPIGNLNPFRYRGYYYDTELSLYYLNSRYYDCETGRFINADSVEYLGANGDLEAFNLFAYCSNDPVNFIDPTGKFILSTFDGFHLFGYELRKSAGWEASPSIAMGFFGRIGVSFYVTHTQGRSGMLYAFAGSTSDIMNCFETIYYAGIGVNLFDFVGLEVQLETFGVGAQVSIGKFSIGANVNLLGATSITFGRNTDLENGMTKTDGFTIGVNTGCLILGICWIFKLITTGDPSPVPGLQPI